MTVPTDSQIPDLPGGDANTQHRPGGTHTLERVEPSPNETTFPMRLEVLLKDIEQVVSENEDGDSATTPPARPAPEPAPAAPAHDSGNSTTRTTASTPEPLKEPEGQAQESSESTSLTLRTAILERIAGRHRKKKTTEDRDDETPPSMPVLIGTGIFTVLACAAAFVLSFTMLLLVVNATGWLSWVGMIGPLVPDIAACAAAVMLVARIKRTLAWTLLVGGTGVSIIGNLAGHAIQRSSDHAAAEHVKALPAGWSWVGDIYSVFVPLVMSVMLHIFMDMLSVYFVWRRKQKALQQAEAERQAREHAAAEQARRQAEQAEAARQERAAEEEAQRQQLLEDLPKPHKTNQSPGKKVGIAYARAHKAFTRGELVRVLDNAGWGRVSPTAYTNWINEAKRVAGVASDQAAA